MTGVGLGEVGVLGPCLKGGKAGMATPQPHPMQDLARRQPGWRNLHERVCIRPPQRRRWHRWGRSWGRPQVGAEPKTRAGDPVSAREPRWAFGGPRRVLPFAENAALRFPRVHIVYGSEPVGAVSQTHDTWRLFREWLQFHSCLQISCLQWRALCCGIGPVVPALNIPSVERLSRPDVGDVVHPVC